MRKPYVEWTVKDESFKLKLTTADIVKLEEKFNTNLINILGIGNGSIPALSVMLQVVHQAMNKYNHGKKLNDVYNLFDDYCDDGGSQMSFMTDVFLPIYQASGFLSTAQVDQMDEGLETAKEQM